MATLHLAFQDGFSNDSIVVQIDGVEVTRQTGLTTSLTTALAGTAEIHVDRPTVVLKLTAPEKKLSRSIELDPGLHPYLGVSLAPGAIALTPSREAFYYM